MTKRVLVVDDSELARIMVRRAVTAAGYEVAGEAVDGPDGLEKFRLLRPDLVIMDEIMPGISGTETVRQILAMEPDAKVLMLSSLAAGLGRELVVGSGAQAALAKPFSPESLARVMRDLLQEATDTAEATEAVGDLSQGTSDTLKLTREQVQDLQEVCNVGAGNATSALSLLVGRRCDVTLPKADYISIDDLRVRFEAKGEFIVAIWVRILGEIPAAMIVHTGRSNAHQMVQCMIGDALAGSRTHWSLTAQLALKQVAERLTESFSQSLNEFVGAEAKTSMPEIITDSEFKELREVLGDLAPEGSTCMVISASFRDTQKSFEGKFYYMFTAAGLAALLSRLRSMRELDK